MLFTCHQSCSITAIAQFLYNSLFTTLFIASMDKKNIISLSLFIKKKRKFARKCYNIRCNTREILRILLSRFLSLNRSTQLIEKFWVSLIPRDPFPLRSVRPKRGFTCLRAAENARRMCVDVRSICFRQSDMRFNVNAHCSQLQHGLHYCIYSRSETSIPSVRARRVVGPLFRKTGASSKKMDFPTS